MRALVLGAALAASIAFPLRAAEASVTITGHTFAPVGYATGTLNETGGGIVGGRTSLANVAIGRVRLNGYVTGSSPMESVTFDSYCIDIGNWLSSSNSTWDVENFALADATKTTQLFNLLSNTATHIANPGSNVLGSYTALQTSAAIQMAIWEIAFNAGTTGYNINSGNFYINNTRIAGSADSGARALANLYLANSISTATPGYGARMLVAINPTGNQRQVFLAAVPEPATWAMLILGFGVVGGALRRGQRQRVTKFALA